MSREWTDREVLDILDLRYRINAASNEVEDVAKRPENRDGGMPARWWDVPTQHRRRA
jgi:hypothetical protein